MYEVKKQGWGNVFAGPVLIFSGKEIDFGQKARIL